MLETVTMQPLRNHLLQECIVNLAIFRTNTVNSQKKITVITLKVPQFIRSVNNLDMITYFC